MYNRLILILLTLLLVSLTTVTGCTSEKKAETGAQEDSTDAVSATLNMGATPQSSSNFLFAVALADSVTEGTDGRIAITAVEAVSSIENIRLVKRGDFQLAYTNTDAMKQAYTGTGEFAQEGAYEELRMLFSYLAMPRIIAVRKESGITSIYELDGKPFSPGPGGSETARTMTEAFDILGIKPDYKFAEAGEGVEMVKNRDIVGYHKAAAGLKSPDSTFVDINTLLPLRTLSYTEEELDTLVKNMNLTPIVVPAGVYQDQTKPIYTSASVASYATSSKLDERIAYEITKSVFENKEIQENALQSVKDINYAELTISTSQVPLHAGAYRYFKEIGIDVPSNLIPPEAR